MYSGFLAVYPTKYTRIIGLGFWKAVERPSVFLLKPWGLPCTTLPTKNQAGGISFWENIASGFEPGSRFCYSICECPRPEVVVDALVDAKESARQRTGSEKLPGDQWPLTLEQPGPALFTWNLTGRGPSRGKWMNMVFQDPWNVRFHHNWWEGNCPPVRQRGIVLEDHVPFKWTLWWVPCLRTGG